MKRTPFQPLNPFLSYINFFTLQFLLIQSEFVPKKGVLKMCSKFTEEHPCRSLISIKLLCNFIEITLRHGCSPVNLLHFSRTLCPKNTSEGLLLDLFTNLFHLQHDIINWLLTFAKQTICYAIL